MSTHPKTAAPKSPKPPASLGVHGRRLWRHVVSGWDLDGVELEVLRQACAALDRAEQARRVLDREGLTIAAGRGSIKTHPAAGVERDARIAFARLLREIGLTHEEFPASARRRTRKEG